MSITVEKQIEEVARLRSEEEPLPFAEIGDRLGISERTARRRFDAAVLLDRLESMAEGGGELKDFPEEELPKIRAKGPYIPEDKGDIPRFQPLERHGDCMVTCDWHIPLHDPELINQMIKTAKANKIKQLIIGGDYFHMEEFSSYLPHQPEASLAIERYDGNLIMKTLLKTFDEIDVFWGNHDFRLSKKLGYKKSFSEAMKWMLKGLSEDEFAKIRFSDLDYMHYYPASNIEDPVLDLKFRLCHPQNFSKVPLSVGRELAVKYRCSIMTAHSHHCAIGAAPNGVDIVIEGGGFFSKKRTEYIQRSNNNHEWVPGFTMFKRGIPRLYSPILGNLEGVK